MASQIVQPGQGNSLVDEYGHRVTPPAGWIFLPAGDAGITRKVTAAGTFWRVQVKKGRRTISKGVWAPATVIRGAQEQVQTVRATEEYQKRRVYAAKQREVKQQNYTTEFCTAVRQFLRFHPTHHAMEERMAQAVTQHAIPVGSGTVARTTMIPVEERAAKAVIAWMRHQTTAYDNLHIAPIKGERRAVRRQLAAQSVKLLQRYRQGRDIPVTCPLKRALENRSLF